MDSTYRNRMMLVRGREDERDEGSLFGGITKVKLSRLLQCRLYG